MAEISYRRHRFPAVIIQHAVWLYLRFTLSYRDVEELLAERGLDISYETVRCWVLKFGPVIARRLRRCRSRPSNRGTSTRWWCGSPASGCTCGAPSITRARFSICWFSAGAILGGAAADAQAAQEARLCAEIAGHRQAALLRLRIPASATDLPA